MPRPTVRMIRHPPSAVPAVRATAHATFTQTGAARESVWPSASSSAATAPMSAGDVGVDPTSVLNVAAKLTLAGDRSVNLRNAAGGQVHVFAGGTIEKTAGSGESFVSPALDNDGTVSAKSGTLRLDGGDAGTTTGAFDATSGKTLHLAGGSWTLPNVTGAGTLWMEAGTVTVPSGATFTIAGVLHSGGDWVLNQSVSLPTYTAACCGSATREGSGTLTITSAATLNTVDLRGPGATTVASSVSSSTLGAGTLVRLGGTLNLNHDTPLTSGGMGVGPTGTLNLGAALSIQGDDGISNFGGGPNNTGAINVLAGGTLQKTGGSGTSFVDDPVTSAGTVTLSSGTLSLLSLTASGGLVNVPASRTLIGPVTLDGGTLAGGGTVNGTVTNNGGTVSPGASPGILTVTGNCSQGAGGTLRIEVQGFTPGTDPTSSE